jgi:RNA recognition motif-containing protein
VKGCKLYVGNLDHSVTPNLLEEQFSYFGKVRFVRLFEGAGFGFVKMVKEADAENAVMGLNGVELAGKRIKVEKARRRIDVEAHHDI